MSFALKLQKHPYICTRNTETNAVSYYQPAGVVKLVDTPDLGSGASRCVGSSPITRTKASDISGAFFIWVIDFDTVEAIYSQLQIYFFDNKISRIEKPPFRRLSVIYHLYSCPGGLPPGRNGFAIMITWSRVRGSSKASAAAFPDNAGAPLDGVIGVNTIYNLLKYKFPRFRTTATFIK